MPGAVQPPDFDAKTSYRSLAAQALGGLKKANQHIAARQRCDDRIISDYAKAK